MSKKHQSLALTTKARAMSLDYSEVAADLIIVLRQNEKIFDPSLFALLEPEIDLVAFLLHDEFSPEVVWNLMNSTLGKGVLLGLLAEAVSNYYSNLEAGNIDEYKDDYSDGQIEN